MLSFLILIRGTPRAFRAPAFRRFRAAGHLDALPVNERIGDLAPRFVEIAPGSFAGDPEPFCRFLLFKAFEINEPDQLDLVGLERDALTLFFRAAAGFVTAGFRRTVDSAPEPRPSPAGTRYLPIAVAGQLLLLTNHYGMLNDLTFAWNFQNPIPDTAL